MVGNFSGNRGNHQDRPIGMIKEIHIGGKMRPVSYGFNALAMFQDLTGIGLSQLGSMSMDTMTLTSMIKFAYCGLKDGARKAKQDFTASIEDVADWLDDDSQAFIDLFSEFVNSQAPEDTGKKKVTKKAHP